LRVCKHTHTHTTDTHNTPGHRRPLQFSNLTQLDHAFKMIVGCAAEIDRTLTGLATGGSQMPFTVTQ